MNSVSLFSYLCDAHLKDPPVDCVHKYPGFFVFGILLFQLIMFISIWTFLPLTCCYSSGKHQGVDALASEIVQDKAKEKTTSYFTVFIHIVAVYEYLQYFMPKC